MVRGSVLGVGILIIAAASAAAGPDTPWLEFEAEPGEDWAVARLVPTADDWVPDDGGWRIDLVALFSGVPNDSLSSVGITLVRPDGSTNDFWPFVVAGSGGVGMGMWTNRDPHGSSFLLTVAAERAEPSLRILGAINPVAEPSQVARRDLLDHGTGSLISIHRAGVLPNGSAYAFTRNVDIAAGPATVQGVPWGETRTYSLRHELDGAGWHSSYASAQQGGGSGEWRGMIATDEWEYERGGLIVTTPVGSQAPAFGAWGSARHDAALRLDLNATRAPVRVFVEATTIPFDSASHGIRLDTARLRGSELTPLLHVGPECVDAGSAALAPVFCVVDLQLRCAPPLVTRELIPCYG